MNGLSLIAELLPVILSSATLSGSILAAMISFAIKKAKNDAETKRMERLSLEMQRLEGEEKLSRLLFALIRYARGSKNDHELETAMEAYTLHLEESNRLKNEIITKHTSG